MSQLRSAAHPGRILAVGALLALATVLAVESADSGPADTAQDLSATAAQLLRPLAAVAPVTIAVLLLTSFVHHLAATGAARAAAGTPLPIGELFATTYTAAAANRVTPAGLGGATVLARFFVRRGGLSVTRAAGSVSALAVLGALADMTAFALLIAAGAVLGVTPMVAEAPRLLAKVTGLISPVGFVVVGAVAMAVTAAALVLRRRWSARVSVVLAGYGAQLRGLAQSPRRLLALLGASSGTTLVLALGFAVAATLPPAGLAVSDIGPLMIGYMVAAAAGTALPVPGGVGPVELALTGVLLAHGVPAGSALAGVLAFRLVTFWAPALAGLTLTRTLRRRGAL